MTRVSVDGTIDWSDYDTIEKTDIMDTKVNIRYVDGKRRLRRI